MPDTPPDLTSQKQDLLLNFYRIAWDEMCWRRNAGYRTVIFGLGYCGIILTVVAVASTKVGVQSAAKGSFLAAVIALATVFGSGYLVSNYYKYMNVLSRMVQIEEYLGAFAPDFLASFGALMPPERRGWSKVPLSSNPVCIWSVQALLAGGLLTAVAIVLISHGFH